MSYSISLVRPHTGEVLEAKEKHFMQGGTYTVGGTKQLWLDVTYNYSEIFCRMFGDRGIRVLDNLTGGESIPILYKAINGLKNDVDDDYWKPTEGNARAALINLARMAQMRTDGVWKIE